MPTFLNAPLLWGLMILGIPILIHLINLFRHRRVPWAAMEFLLASQKRNSRWILLRQLLLLLLRMAAIAAIVLLLARPLLPNRWGSVFGTARTHHVVLLDDSFSMTDRWADTSAFGEAKKVVERLGQSLVDRGDAASFTLVRFSRADATDGADLLEQLVDADFPAQLQRTLAAIEPSQTISEPRIALASLPRLIGPPSGEKRVVYLVSDYRANEWEDPSEISQALRALDEEEVEVHLISCVQRRHDNLAVSQLETMPGTRAAGVPLFMEVEVANYSAQDARDVSVLLEADGQTRPALSIERIPAESKARRRFSVQFPDAGEHQIVARLEGDTVEVDNSRHAVVDFPTSVPVLLVDGGTEAVDAQFLAFALAPGGAGRTGISPRTESVSFLGQRPLDEFAAIYVANFERIDESGIKALEEYARSGGGVALFLGPRCRSAFINDALYRDGEGLFAAPLMPPADLFVDNVTRTPDLEVEEHPIFKVFQGERNSFLDMVIVSRYFPIARGWQPAPEAKTDVLARLRNGAPLFLERTFGEGRVVCILTTAAPIWNNWAQNPSFVVAMLELQAHLAATRSGIPIYQIGAPLRLALDGSKYEPKVRFVHPGDSGRVAEVDAVPGPTLDARFDATDASGIYQAQLTTLDGGVETRGFAYNVDSTEGDLHLLGPEELATRLDELRYVYHRATDFQTDDQQIAGADLSLPLIYALLAMIVGEQVLAYAASYHPPVAGGGRR